MSGIIINYFTISNKQNIFNFKHIDTTILYIDIKRQLRFSVSLFLLSLC